MQRITTRMILLALVSLNIGYGQSSGSRQVFVPGTDRVVTSTPYGSAVGTSGPSIPIRVSRGRQAVLIIPSAELAPERAGELAEDLNVMCAVFDKFLYDAGVKVRSWGRGARRQSRSTRCIYLPDFGPLFLVEAEFPLAPSAQEKPKEQNAPDEDPLWAQVKTSMRSPGAGANLIEGQALAEYDDLKIQNLRSTLLQAVKHASNIHHVGADEQIAVVVVESSEAHLVVSHVRTRGPMTHYSTTAPAEPRALNVLALRTTKAKVDALAKEEVTSEMIQSSVEVLKYQLPLLQSRRAPTQAYRRR